MTLTFEPESHLYKVDGVVVPSVTQVIKEAGLSELEYVPERTLREKADLGNKVHKATELLDRDNLDVESIHPILLNYVAMWEQFKKDFGFEAQDIELTLHHPLYRFAGRIDRVGLVNGKLSIVDIKSGGKYNTHSLQTAGYKLLYDHDKLKKEQIKNRMSVYLSQENYSIFEHKDSQDERVFLAALTITNYKRMRK
jgi:hypothetical protein